ncbi:hypothetical protein [Clostridium isatidis]|uniref:hypothetical protein n=1 Tax=Clostridium isatidis TaxID=182773 RepID=UPI003AAC6D70
MSEFKYGNLLNIKEIKEDTKFWLVRAKSGVFYDEFKNEGYIALGWNYIDNNNVNESDDDKLKIIKEEIERIYKNKQGGTILNKCKRFINEMREGDIVMVPSSENKEILFAIVGDYYEEDKDYLHEVEIIKRIDNKEDYGIEIKCPYKKRRKIKVIKSVNGNKLNPNLYKALVSHHGLSNIDKYSKFILSSIYNLYISDGKLNIVLNIEKERGIDARDFSGLIYSISNILSIQNENIKITTRANINSPGDLVFTIQEYANNIYTYIRDNWFVFIIIYGAIAGIKIGPLDMPSIINAILNVNKHRTDIKEQEAKIQSIELDNQLKKIDLEFRKINLTAEKSKIIKESGIIIKEKATNLNINKEDSCNVINVNFGKTNDE